MPSPVPDIEQMYGLAQDAGIIPSMGGSEQMPWDDLSNVGDPTTPYSHPNVPWDKSNPMSEVMPGTLTPPDSVGAPSIDPNAIGAPEGLQKAGLMTKTGSGGALSLSQGGSGLNFNTLGALDATRDPILGGKLGVIDNQVRNDFAGPMAAYGTAAEEHKDAAAAKMEADLKHIVEERAAATLMKGLHDQFTKSESNILAGETARKNQLIAQYTTSLADYGASKVDPNQLWHGMSGGMRFGTLVTAFVHDFLGARGIKTSAMDTLNTAIDRNINAQVQNINNKLEVSKGFKTLYEMELQRSSSAAEARSRIKGYMLESAKQNIVANMSQYQSLLASAQGKEALAQIDAAYAKNYQDVVGHIETASTARQGQAIQWEEAKMHNAMEGYKASIAAKGNQLEQQKFDYQKEKDNAASLAQAQSIKLVDPETNLNKWKLKDPTDKEGARKTRDALSSVADVNGALERLKTLARKVGGGNIANAVLDGTRFNDEDRREYDGIVEVLAHNMVKQNGERATEPDIVGYKKILPSINTALTNGGIDQIINSTHERTLNNAQHVIQQYAVDLPKEEQTPGPSGRVYEKAAAEAEANRKMAERGGMKPQMIDTAVKEMSSPAGHRAASDAILEATGLDKTTANLAWGAAVRKDPSIANVSKAGGSLFDDESQRDKVIKDPGDAPTWAVAIMGLGDTVKAKGPTSAAAMDKLVNWATKDIATEQSKGDPALDGFSAQDLLSIQHMAQYELLSVTGKNYSTSGSDSSGVINDSDSMMYTGARPRAPGFNR